jgi:predicted TIM-barrel fold metal-dependent hydrolase
MTPPQEYRGNVYRNLVDVDAWVRLGAEAALEPYIPIIDAHHHLWDDARRGRYLIHELARDIDSGHNIVATVFADAGSMYRADGPVALRPVGEVEFVNGVAAMSASGGYGKARLCAGIVGYADLTLGDRVEPVLEALIAAGNGRLRGIRCGVAWDSGNAAKFGTREPTEHMLLDPTFRKGIACIQKLDLSFDAWQFYHQLPDLMDMLKAFPEANIVLTHAGGLLGIPPHAGKREQIFALWRSHIRELARYPNLSVKIGGLGILRNGWDFHLHDTPPASETLARAWRPYVETCIEAFGAKRSFFESNFPPDKQTCGYGVLWNAFKRITGGYSAAEKAALYHDTAARVYRLPGV